MPVLAVRPARDVIAVLRLADGYGDGYEYGDCMHPAERALMRGNSRARRRDFAAGRAAAADALRLLGRSGPVLREARRPRFPTGVRGSISHCRGAVATCLATTRTDVAAVGVDVERVGRLSPETAGLVCTPPERALLAGGDAGGRLLTVVFSAKEAFYKAATALDLPREPVFHDLEVLPDPGHENGNGNGLCLTPAAGLLPDGCTVRGQVRSVGPYVWTTVLLQTDP
ncbi:4'-phosphopantetheinyl transferase superfamily protein [Streptomyces sp. NBC_00190]|uniref:4'-phosphopantetheinyl transferase superfamily protein n=1 Tax=unclassified Streptomyces TaxID=2593676 RepID=UPI002E2DE7A1|nr:4'-phosphopantetheinyl transferase superfamily protein [Streptomyces sp. NBC_00190]WSZ38430.1 4'-phosphopantetheinyl transferase superfamily protein [Streptomyces sp. NBC_00868]